MLSFRGKQRGADQKYESAKKCTQDTPTSAVLPEVSESSVVPLLPFLTVNTNQLKHQGLVVPRCHGLPSFLLPLPSLSLASQFLTPGRERDLQAACTESIPLLLPINTRCTPSSSAQQSHRPGRIDPIPNPCSCGL